MVISLAVPTPARQQRSDPYLAVQLTYPAAPGTRDVPVVLRATYPAAPGTRDVPVVLRAPSPTAADLLPGVGWIGAGTFTTRTLLPSFRRAGFRRFVAITSASGITARRAAERYRFEKAVSGAFRVIDDPDVGVVVIATPHATHAELVTLALKEGRHVWCEEPLALCLDDLADIESAWEASGRQLMAGFNRRWSPAVRVAQTLLAGVAEPKFVVYRVAAGPVPEGHWYADRRQGGRVIGEVCHFVDTGIH